MDTSKEVVCGDIPFPQDWDAVAGPYVGTCLAHTIRGPVLFSASPELNEIIAFQASNQGQILDWEGIAGWREVSAEGWDYLIRRVREWEEMPGRQS